MFALPLNNPCRFSFAVSAYVNTFRSLLPHLRSSLSLALCIWGDSTAQKPLRLDKSNHHTDRISLELCVSRFDPAALSEMLYFIQRPERCCCSCFCLHWYRLMTLSEDFDDTVAKAFCLASRWLFFFLLLPWIGWHSWPSQCSHLSSIINHSVTVFAREDSSILNFIKVKTQSGRLMN